MVYMAGVGDRLSKGVDGDWWGIFSVDMCNEVECWLDIVEWVGVTSTKIFKGGANDGNLLSLWRAYMYLAPFS